MAEAIGLAELNGAGEDHARDWLERCCGAQRWVRAMVSSRPFASAQALFERAAHVYDELERADYLEAFSHHPEIGANMDELRERFAKTAEWSQREQAGALTATDAVLHALRDKNRAYRERFGYSFIVCATGKTAAEMLALLEERLRHSPEEELGVAAMEQKKIMILRLQRLAA